MYSDEENRDYYKKKMKNYEERISNAWDIPLPVAISRNIRAQEIKKDNTDIERDKEDEYVWKP